MLRGARFVAVSRLNEVRHGNFWRELKYSF